MAELTDQEMIAKWGNPADALPSAATNMAPLTTAQVAALGTSGSNLNVPPTIGDTRRRQEALGERTGVPFHEEGLPTWTDLMTKSRQTDEEKLRFLAKTFGTENVRLNEFREPVVTIKNPETGQPEDYPMNPRQLTINSLTGLARFAPDTAGAILGEALAPEVMGHKVVSTLLKAFSTAVGMEAGGTARQIGAEALSEPLNEMAIKQPIIEHLSNVPLDFGLNLGLAGLVKTAQIAKGLGLPKMLGGGGINIPNPVGGTSLVQPARPEFTAEVNAAAARNEALSGIPSKLPASVTTGIPVIAMMEKYLSRKPAGASPMIAMEEERDAASKAFQNFMVDPTTLGTDEAVGRGALTTIGKTIEPLKKDVELAQFSKETVEKNLPAVEKAQREEATLAAQKALTTSQQAVVLPKMYAKDIPTKGVDLSPTGDVLRTKVIAERDAFKNEADRLYNEFYSNPLSTQKIISGKGLKTDVDEMLKSLPTVEKQQPLPGGGMQTVTEPVSTPIRPRLEELSEKLAGGKISISDLKQIRTDVNDAILRGEAIPGVKEGRLKQLAGSLTDAIHDGLAQIKDPDLSKAFSDATKFYRDNVDRFTGKNLSSLFKEADQTSSVGNRDFVANAIANQDKYTALRDFFGLKSPEMSTFRDTVRQHLLGKSASASDGMIDGNQLVGHLEQLRDNNQQLFKDAFADKGNQLIEASNQLGEWQRRVPAEAVDKLLVGKKATNQSYLQGQIVALQDAQKRLNVEYQNRIVNRFLKNSGDLSALEPDKFVASLPDAKLSDVQGIMTRLEKEDPDMADQVARKAIQDLLSRSRRVQSPPNTMAKLNEQPGDLISGSGLENALGKGDQLLKYKTILGDRYQPLVDFAKTELGMEERERLASGVGILAPGSAMNAIMKLLKPWESASPGKGIMREAGSLAVDKAFSIFMGTKTLRDWLASPYALKDATGAIKLAMVSQPFLKGMATEFSDAQSLAKMLSILKIATGTASQGQPQTNVGAGPSDAEMLRKYSGAAAQPTPP